MTKTTHSLDQLFEPSSIAIVGASGDHQKAGGRFVRGLLDGGYRGTIYPVNPGSSEIMGLKAYRGVLELPPGVDLAILAIPSRAVPEVIAECAIKKVKFAIVHAAGFSELGSEGRELEQEVIRLATAGKTRILGPNCMGIYVPKSRINTIVYGAPITGLGSVAFIGQSGWVTENVIVLGRERGLRFSKVVSIGNQSDITIEEVIDYLAQDPDTSVIALYAEGIKRGRDFFHVVRQATKKKPVVVWKSGRSVIGARAASSHTASLAGNATVFDALADQSGMVQARDLDELMDLMVGFSCPVYPRGKRVAILCESGGGAVSASDAAEISGLDLPLLSKAAQKKLVDALTGRIPPFAPPKNPVDIVWGPSDNPAGLFVACGRVMLSEADAAVMLDYQKFDESLANRFCGLRDETGKPIFVVPGYVTHNRHGMAILTEKGLPSFDTPGKALKVLGSVARYVNEVKAK